MFLFVNVLISRNFFQCVWFLLVLIIKTELKSSQLLKRVFMDEVMLVKGRMLASTLLAMTSR